MNDARRWWDGRVPRLETLDGAIVFDDFCDASDTVRTPVPVSMDVVETSPPALPPDVAKLVADRENAVVERLADLFRRERAVLISTDVVAATILADRGRDR